MATHHRRTSSVERASVESILKSSGQPAAPPPPHVGNSPNRAYFAMSPPPRPITKHSRAMSYNPRPNRLSMSFPIAPSTSSNESARPTPTSSTIPFFPPTPADIAPAPSPSDPSGFLVALASQERRVLELREELHKAEDDLRNLKSQWAQHERHKKKAEIRHMEPLQPLQTIISEAGASTQATGTTRQSAEVDRRRAILSNLNIPKETRRKFSGTHTRALSLLSPERSNFKTPSPFGSAVDSGEENGLPRTTTIPDTSQGLSRINSHRARHSYHQGGLSHGAKQIAEDLKSGLWTFMEDLRQATVGDEAVHGVARRAGSDTSSKGPRKQSSRGNLPNDKRRGQSPGSTRTWDSLTGNSPLLDATGWAGSEPQKSKAPAAKTPAKKSTRPISLAPAPVIDDLDDDWSNWDSPTPKSPPARWSGSSTMSDPATPSNKGGDDPEVEYDSPPVLTPFIINKDRIIGQSTDENGSLKREDIQWPALDKLSPGNLKGNLQRTMSTIMKEWEKSITPPPDDGSNSTTKPKMNQAESSEASKSSTQDDVLLLSR